MRLKRKIDEYLIEWKKSKNKIRKPAYKFRNIEYQRLFN